MRGEGSIAPHAVLASKTTSGPFLAHIISSWLYCLLWVHFTVLSRAPPLPPTLSTPCCGVPGNIHSNGKTYFGKKTTPQTRGNGGACT
jgi:hypothetical protein